MSDSSEWKCRGCDCTEADACVDKDGTPCSWAEVGLCSSCAAIPTHERLARDLEHEGLPVEMVERARAGYYDDWHPNAHEQGIVELFKDLQTNGRVDLAILVREGRWDGSRAESDAWAESEEGQKVYAQFGAELTARFDQAVKENGGDVAKAKEAVSDAMKVVDDTNVEDGEHMADELRVKDRDMLVAAVDLVKRAGGQHFRVGVEDDGTWWAEATMKLTVPSNVAGKTMLVERFQSPEYAAEALARRIVQGEQCQHCNKPVAIGGPRVLRLSTCRWKRVGDKWLIGCK